MMVRRLCLLSLLVSGGLPCEGQQAEQAATIQTYKTLGTAALTIHIFFPREMGKDRTAVVLFHGGGFVSGSPAWTYGAARAYAARGAVAFAVEYRLCDREHVTPVEQAEDAFDAIRWVRQHAEQYGIGQKRLVLHGVSAGGTLAALAAERDDPSLAPNALVLWSPGLATGVDPWFIGLMQKRAPAAEFSPDQHVRAGMPPTIIVSGVEDAVTPDADARRFCSGISKVGGRCEIHSYPRLGHLLTRKLDPRAQLRGDFDWDPEATQDADGRVWGFLTSLGLLERQKQGLRPPGRQPGLPGRD